MTDFPIVDMTSASDDICAERFGEVFDENEVEDGRCRNENVDPCCEVESSPDEWVCTRPPHHFGDHAAWAEEHLVARWTRA